MTCGLMTHNKWRRADRRSQAFQTPDRKQNWNEISSLSRNGTEHYHYCWNYSHLLTIFTMADESSDKEAPLLVPPGDAKPSLYTFKEFSTSDSNSDSVYCPPTGTNFRNIHCVGKSKSTHVLDTYVRTYPMNGIK
jgi:hypothetical protein